MAKDEIPTPRDDLSSTAGWFMGHVMPTGLTAAELATADPEVKFVSLEYAIELFKKGKSLAGFVLRSDTQKGPNKP